MRAEGVILKRLRKRCKGKMSRQMADSEIASASRKFARLHGFVCLAVWH